MAVPASQAELAPLFDLLHQGRHKAVSKLIKPLLKKHPQSVELLNLSGVAQCGQHKLKDGVSLFKKALALDPTFTDSRKNLAQTLILLGQPETALPHLERILSLKPAHQDALFLKSQALWTMGELQAAATALDSAIAYGAAPARLFNLRALVRNGLGLEKEALADFEAALSIDPNNVETLVNASLPLARQSRHEESQAVITQALKLAPAHLGANLRQVHLDLENGNKEAVLTRCKEILSFAPRHPEVLQLLAQVSAKEDTEKLIRQLEKLVKPLKRCSEDRARLHFSLAYLLRNQSPTRSFVRHLTAANKDMAELYPYDAEADRKQTVALLQMAATSSPDSDVDEAGFPVQPLFITGLPRSGTSLAEALVGAHPLVHPLGERAAAGFLAQPFIEEGRHFNLSEQRQFAQEYLDRLPDIPQQTCFFTDKMPENYRYIGLLAQAFPKARFLCLNRDPRDVALSMWQAHFSGKALAYTYDLPAMAHRFNLKARLQNHWQSLFPDRILNVSYEALVADIEGESRRIAEFIGLDWCPEMAQPHKNEAPVLTLSAAQLRQPVHQRSVGRWHNYHDMLAPFIDELDPKLWPQID